MLSRALSDATLSSAPLFRRHLLLCARISIDIQMPLLHSLHYCRDDGLMMLRARDDLRLSIITPYTREFSPSRRHTLHFSASFRLTHARIAAPQFLASLLQSGRTRIAQPIRHAYILKDF